jgi:hypothetical protein
MSPNMTAPMTRGPAHGPRPTSSMPRVVILFGGFFVLLSCVGFFGDDFGGFCFGF